MKRIDSLAARVAAAEDEIAASANPPATATVAVMRLLREAADEHERMVNALRRIAMNISGDLPAQVIAGDTLGGRTPGS